MPQLTPEGHRPGGNTALPYFATRKVTGKGCCDAFETKTPEKPLRFKGVLCLKKSFAYSAISGFSFFKSLFTSAIISFFASLIASRLM